MLILQREEVHEIAVTTWPTAISARVVGSCVNLSTGPFMMATSSSSALGRRGETEGGGEGDEQCAHGRSPGVCGGRMRGVDE